MDEKLTAVADAQMIHVVIHNLLSNAAKFTPHGGRIVVSATRTENQVEVTVSDTGVGIAEKELGHVFKMDSKTSTPGTDKESGTGLGLILCREFVEKNGGRIWVESEAGAGSRFSFTVPASGKL